MRMVTGNHESVLDLLRKADPQPCHLYSLVVSDVRTSEFVLLFPLVSTYHAQQLAEVMCGEVNVDRARMQTADT